MTVVHGTSHQLMEEDPATVITIIENFIATVNESTASPQRPESKGQAIGKNAVLDMQALVDQAAHEIDRDGVFDDLKAD